jgi:hypothetical protein
MRPQYTKLDAFTIKGSINPNDFYLREQNLHSFGHGSGQWAIAGLCPFHDDKKHGSFKINLITGAFRCWSCGACGCDIIAFIQKRDGLEFIDTLRKSCSDWGLSC